MGTTVATPLDFWRLADEAERRGIRILVEPISNEHFATSATNVTKLYRLTHLSCTCKGFMTWQRCTHHSLLLAHLGWLPDIDPEPTPTPAAAVPATPQLPCPECRSTGTEIAMGRSGSRYRVPCFLCSGAGHIDALNDSDGGSSDDGDFPDPDRIYSTLTTPERQRERKHLHDWPHADELLAIPRRAA